MSEFELKPNKKAIKKKKRLGRGIASGHGKTCTKGHKGQKCRSGRHLPYVGFEGGQMPIYRRVPKRGFNSLKKNDIEIINLDQLNKYFDDNSEVNLQTLIDKKLVKKETSRVKLLSDGELTKKLTIKVSLASKNAIKKVEESGSSIEVEIQN